MAQHLYPFPFAKDAKDAKQMMAQGEACGMVRWIDVYDSHCSCEQLAVILASLQSKHKDFDT